MRVGVTEFAGCRRTEVGRRRSEARSEDRSQDWVPSAGSFFR